MSKLKNYGFHLPHNAILPEETKYIISIINENKEFYIYEELKALIFERLVKDDKFKDFHSGMYENIMKNSELRKIYELIRLGTADYNLIRDKKYTTKKTFNQVWNEQTRDYLEFLAFCGLMPSYYKGKFFTKKQNQYNEKRHYVGFTLKDYKSGRKSFQDVLFKFKFRNALKDYTILDEYNVKNRPFVVALKVMNIFKNKGYNELDGRILAYYVTNITDEDQFDYDGLKIIDIDCFNNKDKKELGRINLFLKGYLIRELNVELKSNNPTIYNIKNFDIKNYHFKDRTLFIGEDYNGFEVTPKLIVLLNNVEKANNEELNLLKSLNFISNDNKVIVDYNVDTDLPERRLAEEVFSGKTLKLSKIEKTDFYEQLYEKGKRISGNSDGKLYEDFIFETLQKKFSNFELYKFGAHYSAQRVSDIALKVDLLEEYDKRKLLIIFEIKAGNAIKSFDDRKEIDNIENTITTLYSDNNYDFDGLWYIIVDSDAIPRKGGHGGYRVKSKNQLSFEDKLTKIQQNMMMSLRRLTIVTAFTYEKYMDFIDSIRIEKDDDIITKYNAPYFWTWTNYKYKYVDIVS